MLKRLITTSVLVVLVGAASGANAFTNTSDKRTYFTFSQPVALPGVTLPAGTYMFRLADDTTTRKVIQVTNREGTQSFAMLHTMPVYRLGRTARSRSPIHGDCFGCANRCEGLVARG